LGNYCLSHLKDFWQTVVRHELPRRTTARIDRASPHTGDMGARVILLDTGFAGSLLASLAAIPRCARRWLRSAPLRASVASLRHEWENKVEPAVILGRLNDFMMKSGDAS